MSPNQTLMPRDFGNGNAVRRLRGELPPPRVYRRDPCTGEWADEGGRAFTLDAHGGNRIDLVRLNDKRNEA